MEKIADHLEPKGVFLVWSTVIIFINTQCKFLLFFLKFGVAKAQTSINSVKKYLYKAYI